MDNPQKILVVDDEPKNIRLLASFLVEEGYHIEYALNGKEAIKWANNQTFDLILLDIMMPEIDGYETCSRIKEIHLQNNTPIIFVTAKTDIDSTVKGFQVGGVDYIVKPFQRDELIARVKTHISLKLAKENIKRLYKNVKELNQNLTDSIKYASYIQSSILPSDKIFKEILPNSFIEYLPKDSIGGDFYWIRKKKNKILLAVGDCTGHGVPGAMLSMLSVSILTNAYSINTYNLPSEIIEYVVSCISEFISQNKQAIKDSVEFGLCIIDTETNKLQYSGNKFPLIITTNDNIDKYKIQDSSYNITIQEKPNKKICYCRPKIDSLNKNYKNRFSDLHIQLSDTDCIYLYSDGLVDQFGGMEGKKFKRQNLLDILLNIAHLDMSVQGPEISNNIHQWKKGHPQTDDITIVGFSPKNTKKNEKRNNTNSRR